MDKSFIKYTAVVNLDFMVTLNNAIPKLEPFHILKVISFFLNCVKSTANMS